MPKCEIIWHLLMIHSEPHFGVLKFRDLASKSWGRIMYNAEIFDFISLEQIETLGHGCFELVDIAYTRNQNT